MVRSKEILVLLALLVAAVVFVLWYVADRRAAMRAAPPAAPKAVGPVAPAPAPAVELGGANERKTLDFSGGRPVVKDTPEDRAALEAGLQDIAAATRDITFGAPKKAAAPAAPPPPPKEPGQP